MKAATVYAEKDKLYLSVLNDNYSVTKIDCNDQRQIRGRSFREIHLLNLTEDDLPITLKQTLLNTMVSQGGTFKEFTY